MGMRALNQCAQCGFSESVVPMAGDAGDVVVFGESGVGEGKGACHLSHYHHSDRPGAGHFWLRRRVVRAGQSAWRIAQCPVARTAPGCSVDTCVSSGLVLEWLREFAMVKEEHVCH
jgi:hypothetical protein